MAATVGTLVLIGTLALLSVGGCGDDGSEPPPEVEQARGLDDRKIARGLDMRLEGNQLIYEAEPGKECKVIEILPTSADVERILETSENAPESLATTPDGGAGVEFVGPAGVGPPGYCVPAAEADLGVLVAPGE